MQGKINVRAYLEHNCPHVILKNALNFHRRRHSWDKIPVDDIGVIGAFAYLQCLLSLLLVQMSDL